MWCVPGLSRKSDRERIKRERKQERDRENQERRSKTSKDIKRRIPKINEKTQENQKKKKTKAQRNFENNLEGALGASKKWQAATMKPPGPSKSTWKRPSARQMHPEAPECQKVLKNM